MRMRRQTALPLSSAQRGIWFAHAQDATARLYTCAECLQLTGPLDVPRFHEAWSALCAETEALRVQRFSEDPDDGLCQVLGPSEPELLKVDLHTASDPEGAAEEWMRRDLDTPIDLSTGPISRFALIRVDAERRLLYLRMHHAVTDAYSMSLLQHNLADIYTALTCGRPRGAPRAGDLAELAAEDAAYRSGDEFGADRDYWIQRFGDRPEPMRLTGSRPTRRADRPIRARHTQSLATPDTESLFGAAASLGTTWQALLTAATAAYLRRVTGRRDVVLGLPVSGRRSLVARRTPGMAAGTVGLRVEVTASATVRQLAPAVVDEIRHAQRHERFRIEDLARELGVDAARSGPIGPVINFMPYDRELRFGDVVATAVNLSAGPTIDLSFGVVGSAERGLSVVIDANPDLHEPDTLPAHADRWVEFVRACVADPDRPVSSIDPLTSAESDELLVRRNATARPRDGATVVDLVRRAAALAPDAVAVSGDTVELTYRELDAASAALAARLVANGARGEDVVALALPRSPEMIVAMLAVLRAGAAYLPVDLSYPAQRIGHMLADCAPRCVIVADDQETLGAVAASGLPTLAVGERDVTSVPDSAAPDVPDLGPAVAAYVIYTSGSTGSPKGVVVPHRALANLALDHSERFGLRVGSRYLQYVSPSFDAAVSDIWSCLTAGAHLLLAPQPSSVTAAELVALLRKERITHCAIPPAVLAELPDDDLPDLAVLVVGGDFTDPEVAARWAQGRRMLNLYGPTEAGVTATGVAIDPSRAASIGAPIANVAVYVLDGDLLPVPPGVAGELHIAGAGVARGYANQPRLTAERFLPCPFGPPGARMYRTGDLARWNGDGALEYLGRSDDQVKIRGFRVEIGEIESVLSGQRGVRSAVVTMHVADGGAKRLAAYVTPQPGVRLDPAEVRSRLRAALPEFMVPASMQVLERLPLQPNGKLDRHALPLPQESTPADGPADGPPPLPGRQATLCALFAEVLGREAVGIHDSFFEIGGDSILALRLVSAAHDAGLEFTSRDVFRRPTVAQLAEAARERPGSVADAPDDDDGPLPTTPVMRWALALGGAIDGFHQAVRVQVPAGATAERLTVTLRAVVDRHPALRFRLLDDDTLDVAPAASTPPVLTRVDVTGLSPAELTEVAAAERAAAAAQLRPAQGRLARAVWLDAGPGVPGALLFVLHHLAVDGVSWRILLSDLADAWAASDTPASVDTPAPAGTSFRGWARRLAVASNDPQWTGQAELWRRILATEDPPVGRRALDPSVDTFATAETTGITLGPELAEPLLATLPARYRAGQNDILLTALALAAQRWRARAGARGTAVLVDVEGHGREDLGGAPVALERAVGWFTSIYPAAVDPGTVSWDSVVSGGADAGRALIRVKEQLRTIPDHGIGYGILRYLNRQTAATLAVPGAPKIGFSYLGRLSVPERRDWALTGADAFAGEADPSMAMPHAVELTAIGYDRAGGADLRLLAMRPSGLLSSDEVSELLDLWRQALVGLARHAGTSSGRVLTPSDAPLTQLDQDDLDEIVRRRPDVVDVLPLTPLQEGFLLHHLTAGNGVDVYNAQIRVTLDGPLDPERLRDAASLLLRRHPNLRAAFVHEGVAEPVQVIGAEPPAPWTEVDLSGYDADERRVRAERLAYADRAARFALDRPPMLRFLLLRMGERRHQLALTAHHILWDGWSISIVLRELFACYTHGDADSLPEPPRYQAYLAWLAGQDRDAARRAWARDLAGLAGPTLVAPGGVTGQVAQESLRQNLSEKLGAALTARARRHGVTLNTVVELAWAATLSTLTGDGDVVLGTAVSGRQPDLPGSHDMVGLLANTVPVRVRLDPAASVTAALMALHEEQSALLGHHHLGLADIQRQAPGLQGGRSLFDTTVLVVNYPFDTAAWQAELSDLTVAGYEGEDDTHYPFRLVVVPGSRPQARLDYRPDVFDQRSAADVLGHVLAALSAIAADPQMTVSELVRRTGAGSAAADGAVGGVR